MTSSFLIEDILQKKCEKSPAGNMLNDSFYFLQLFAGSTRGLAGNQTKRHINSCYVRLKSEMLALRPVPFLTSPSSPLNIALNKNIKHM